MYNNAKMCVLGKLLMNLPDMGSKDVSLKTQLFRGAKKMLNFHLVNDAKAKTTDKTR